MDGTEGTNVVGSAKVERIDRNDGFGIINVVRKGNWGNFRQKEHKNDFFCSEIWIFEIFFVILYAFLRALCAKCFDKYIT